MSEDRKTIKEVAVEWAEGLYTGEVLTEDTKSDIIGEMENIPSTGDLDLREAVREVMIEMAMEGQLDGDFTNVCFDTIFEKAEDILQGKNK